jgi:hypothetical protein
LFALSLSEVEFAQAKIRSHPSRIAVNIRTTMAEGCDAMDVDYMALSERRTESNSHGQGEVGNVKASQHRPRRSFQTASQDSFTSAQVTELSSKLVRAEATDFFDKNHEALFVSWISLLRNTSFTGDMTCSDPNVASALRTIDRIITGQEGMQMLLTRVAYIRLIHLFERLEKMAALDRRNGLIHREFGYRNASIAVDIYLGAQEGRGKATYQRRELLERKRIGQRWLQLAGPSPLFLLIYSEEAEQIV